MHKIILSFFMCMVGLNLVSHVYAAYTETLLVEGNTFTAGKYQFQLSTTDTDGNGIADSHISNWVSIPTAVWTAPEDWIPTQKVENTIFLRSGGNVDIGRLTVKFLNAGNSGPPLRDYIKLESAWYDKNGNGVKDPGEDLLPQFIELYDQNNDNRVTLNEIINGSGSIKLESDGSVLPGSLTNDELGGRSGTGKGLTLEWYLLGDLPLEYGGATTGFTLSFESAHQ